MAGRIKLKSGLIREAIDAIRDFIRAKGAVDHAYPFLSKQLTSSFGNLTSARADMERSKHLIELMAYSFLCWYRIRRDNDNKIPPV